MERNVLKKRIKGLLAFMLVFMLMFGSSLTVLAAQEWNQDTLYEGAIVNGGDSIKLTVSGSMTVYIDNVPTDPIYSAQSVSLPAGCWSVTLIDSQSVSSDTAYSVYLQSLSTGNTGSRCDHDYRWIIGIKPTEEKDGRFDYKCKWCDSVIAHQPMTFFYAIIWNILEDIEEAPENGVVTVDNKYLRCLTDEIIEALQKRPDVTLDVKFTDQEVPLHFTIPAGMAPTDGAEWYGYYYLGTVYGWIWE